MWAELGLIDPGAVRHPPPMVHERVAQAIDPPPPDTSPIRGLLRTTISAILYATSASVETERRPPPAPSIARGRGAPPAVSSEEVYFLPGTIDISRVRNLQEIERAPDGRELVRRHMVRGHWRRAQKTWADQHLRWIEPYWKARTWPPSSSMRTG